jgi:ABC-type Fe3+ transport system substrate-binding protein
VVIISQSENKAEAQKFIDFVLSTPSQQQLSTLGYTPVEEAIK